MLGKLSNSGVFIYTVLISLFLIDTVLTAQENTIISIWEGKPLFNRTMQDMQRAEEGTDGVTRYYDITLPTLDYYKPAKPNGSAVIICPGGGYVRIAYTHEGVDMAKWFTKRGVSAFILKYRIPNDKYMDHKYEAPLADAQQAIYYVRKHASDFGINVNEVGIVGFSAGGHVASTLSTHFEKSIIPNKEKINLRPNFSVLVYPVITMNKSFTHMGSRESLLGKNPSESLVKEYSNELHVTDETPMTFLVQASDDHAVPVENSLSYYRALLDHNIPAVLHTFEAGGHGWAMKNPWNDKQWLYLLNNWLIENNIIGESD